MKRIICIFVSIVLLCAPIMAFADDDDTWRETLAEIEAPRMEIEGEFTIVRQGEEAPFDGFLFDPLGMSKIISEYDYAVASLTLQYEYREKRQDAFYQLKIDIAQGRYDALKYEYETRMEIKNDEIEFLRESRKKSPDILGPLFFSGGMILGIVTSIAIFAVATGIQYDWQ